MTSYTTATWNADGGMLWSSELPTTSGIDIAATCTVGTPPTMQDLASLMSTNSIYFLHCLKDSDAVVVNVEGSMLLNYQMTMEAQKLFAMYAVRLNSTSKLGFVGRTQAKLLTLAEALISVGYNVSSANLPDDYSTLAARQTLNAALKTAGVPLAIWAA